MCRIMQWLQVWHLAVVRNPRCNRTSLFPADLVYSLCCHQFRARRRRNLEVCNDSYTNIACKSVRNVRVVLVVADDNNTDLVPSHWPDGSMKQAMYALGFDSTRNMLGHVLDMQQREEEFALVRAHRREVGAMLIETWLNDVLSHDRSRDSTCLVKGSTQGQGLHTYGIDRVQLRKAGLSDMQVDRLHRSLYVYSVGFGDMLQVCMYAAGRMSVHCSFCATL